MMLCSLLSYIDRQTLAVLSPAIPRDTGLTAQSYGEIVSAFSIAYMLANPIWGSLLDYIGLRAGMTIAVAMWTVSSTGSRLDDRLLRICDGKSGARPWRGRYLPRRLRAAMESLPSGRQSRRIAISYSGGSLGGHHCPGAGSAARDTIRLEGSVSDDRSLRSPLTGYMGFCIPAALSHATALIASFLSIDLENKQSAIPPARMGTGLFFLGLDFR